MDFENLVERDGLALHQAVPPCRWCVTRKDLRQLWTLCRERVAQGRIVPTDLDAFDLTDEVIGPCIHTVTMQLIAPITEKAGKMSWALMLHPEGLECDVFVTHCWQEGIYEFIDKVLASWPRRARHAYCCMLSNPQNLDISGLIMSPRDSPFAKALNKAPYMLVVPNSKVSIYSRIWCAYEAFLAVSESKVIITASASIPHLQRQVRAVCLAMAVVCGTCWLVVYLVLAGTRSDAPSGQGVDALVDIGALLNVVQFVIFLMLGLLGPSSFTRACEHMLVVLGGALVAIRINWAVEDTSIYDPHFFYDATVDILLFGLCLASVCAHVDRAFALRAAEEARQLRNGYTGHVRDAQSTCAQDKQRILEEVVSSGSEKDVDAAVQVLLDCGVSTPTMRATIRDAGRLARAGYWRLSSVVAICTAWFMVHHAYIPERLNQHVNLVENGECTLQRINADCSLIDDEDFQRECVKRSQHCPPPAEDPGMWLAILGMAQVIAWLVLFYLFEKDRRGFAARSLVGTLVPPLIVVVAMSPYSHISEWILTLVFNVFGLLPILLACMGPKWVAAVPGVGRWIVRGLMLQPTCAKSSPLAAAEQENTPPSMVSQV